MREEASGVAETITKTQRWLDLIAFLIGRRLPVTVEQIMEGVPPYAADWGTGDPTARDSVRRKFERDKDELRNLGIPIETVVFRVDGEEQEGYRLARKDFYLPYLRIVGREKPPGGDRRRQEGVASLELRPEEAGAALDALWRVRKLPQFPYAAEARSAFRKLSCDLDPDAFGRPPVLHVDRPDSGEIGPKLRTLAEALNARKRVQFVYHGIYRDEDTERNVAPYGLVFQGGHWYLVGHDALRDDLRMLRVSRMRDLDPNRAKPHTADYEIPPDFRLSEYVGRKPWELGSPEEGALEARVRFRFPRSLWAARNRHGELEEEDEDGSSVRRFDVRQVNPFLRWVLGFEGEAEILEPPELRDALREMAGRVATLHERASADVRDAGMPDAGMPPAEEGDDA